MTCESDTPAQGAAEAVARRSYGKLVALLATQTRDVDAAEDALAEAFSSALAHWPSRGCPSNPEAWLLAAARRKVIDGMRRRRSAERSTSDLQLLFEELDSAQALTTAIPDHRLALMFACAHPAIEVGIRAPLMLQVVLGFDAKRIASAFLVSPGTMGQRLTRAKSKSGKHASRFASRIATSSRVDSTSSSTRSTPRSRRDGLTPAAPTSCAAISRTKHSSSVDS